MYKVHVCIVSNSDSNSQGYQVALRILYLQLLLVGPGGEVQLIRMPIPILILLTGLPGAPGEPSNPLNPYEGMKSVYNLAARAYDISAHINSRKSIFSLLSFVSLLTLLSILTIFTIEASMARGPLCVRRYRTVHYLLRIPTNYINVRYPTFRPLVLLVRRVPRAQEVQHNPGHRVIPLLPCGPSLQQDPA